MHKVRSIIDACHLSSLRRVYIFKGPANLVHQVNSSEIHLAWQNPPVPKDFSGSLQYQVVLEREDGNKIKKKATFHKKSSRFKCEFGGLWSSTSYVVKCFTLVDGKRKYAPTVIKVKTKNGTYSRFFFKFFMKSINRSIIFPVNKKINRNISSK